jgi:hypothetical protein
MTKRIPLADSSPEVMASDIKGRKFEADRQAAYDNHRRILVSPIEDHAAYIAKVANGEKVPPYVDRDSQIRAAANECRDTTEVCNLHHKNSRSIRQKALAALCKTLVPEERAILKRKASALVEAHAAERDLQELRDYLIGEGGLVGICLTDSESKILGRPSDRTSDLAMLLREFVSMGVLDKMPSGLK